MAASLAALADHAIFQPPKDANQAFSELDLRGDLASSVASTSSAAETQHAQPKRVVCIREGDVILAVGSSLRISPLATDKTQHPAFKVLDAAHLRFDIRQISLSPNGNLLAVAGTHQVAVVVLPRPGYWKTDSQAVEVKSLAVGTHYHPRRGGAAIIKVDWHPWGEHGAILLVGTADGKIREYDVSSDPAEPQQTTSLMPATTRKTFLADADERELVSFTLASGEADWGPLTLYGLMRNGDIYAVCPYLPRRAALPPSYIWALRHCVSQKMEETRRRPGFAALYDQQLRYVEAIESQMPATSRVVAGQAVSVSLPSSTNLSVARQGPFLLQPEPNDISDDAGGAVDIAYVSIQTENKDQLGVVLVSYQSGKIDVFLDLEKIEARWEHMQSPLEGSSTFTTYETIDLGFSSMLSRAGLRSTAEAASKGCPSFLVDPLYNDTIYVYHAFGVHCLWVRQWVTALLDASVAADSEPDDKGRLANPKSTDVFCLLDSFSATHHSTAPVVGLFAPDNVYAPYGLVAVTSTLQCTVFELPLRVEGSQHPLRRVETGRQNPESSKPAERAYVPSLEPWTVPGVFTRPAGFAPTPRIVIPPSQATSGPMMVNPATLRLWGSAVEKVRKEVGDIQLANKDLQMRVAIQQHEIRRQAQTAAELRGLAEKLKGAGLERVQARLERIAAVENQLLQRTIRAAQGLMVAACPTLSEQEAAWFQELSKLKSRISASESGKSLKDRIDVLEGTLEEIRPDMSQISLLKEQKPATPMGSSQVLRIKKRLKEEADLIKDITSKLADLRSRLGLEQSKS